MTTIQDIEKVMKQIKRLEKKVKEFEERRCCDCKFSGMCGIETTFINSNRPNTYPSYCSNWEPA